MFRKNVSKGFAMAISVHARGIRMTESLKSWVETKLESAVSRLGHRGQSVRVLLFDENGPNRGGEDKACRVVVRMARNETLVVEDKDVHIHALVDRVCDRIALAIDRRAERRRAHR